jgi:pSer/pThr/pTyr-binding forkhead associated (FHA) protein
MAVILEVKAGPFAGKRVEVRLGQQVSIGRTSRASCPVPDEFMSGMHFAVECGPQRSRLIDWKSANGTFLNGAKISDATLSSGDQIRAGQTIFAVTLVADDKLTDEPRPAPARPPDSPTVTTSKLSRQTPVPQIPAGVPPPPEKAMPSPPRPATRPSEPPRPSGAPGKSPLLRIGAWAFFAVPDGWEVKDEFGIQRSDTDKFPSTVTAIDEVLRDETGLQPFVELQISMLRQYLRDSRIEAVLSPAISGADEKACFDVRYSTKDGQILFYRRVYARSGKTVGTITLTALENDWEQIRPAFDAILAGVRFQGNSDA